MASETVQIRAYEVRLSTKVRCHFAYRGVALLSPVFAVSAARQQTLLATVQTVWTGWARAVRSGLGTRAGGSGRAVTGACRGRSTALSGGFRTWPPMEGTEWLENCEDRRDEGVQSCGVRGSFGEPALSSRSF
jgi:hypothetical protein